MENREDMLVRAQTIIRELRVRLAAAEQVRVEPVAIVGMACRFPVPLPAAIRKADEGLETFWQTTLSGASAEREVPAGRGMSSPERQPFLAAFLENVDLFDASFFDIPASEAVEMDPTQRLFLEVAWHALEDAGETRERLAGSETGVFVGHTGFHEYLRQHMAAEAEVGVYTGTGSGQDVIAGRLAYFLNLHGPAMTVNTACSSSLVAVHLARRSLLAGECRMAVAGGVNVLGPVSNALAMQMGFMATDGRCKTFDERADGFGRGEGCGVIIMKRLSDAEADGDLIHAVIHGSAINQDGRTNGLSAPNGLSQSSLLRRALRDARVTASQVGYVEAHGTGTPLGDLIESGAIAEVYGLQTRDSLPCALGSAKANVGHQESAAGVAGLIRAVLSIERSVIPPLAGFRKLNPAISLDETRLAIPAESVPWPGAYPGRYAGVSSFGWSGTNAHVVLGEAPQPAMREPPADSSRAVMLAVSAADAKALRVLAQAMAETFESDTTLDLQDLAWSAGKRRSHFAWRIAVVGTDHRRLAAKLRERASEDAVQTSITKTGFFFATEVPECKERLAELTRDEPVFRDAVEECLREFGRAEAVTPTPRDPAEGERRRSLFALHVGVAALLKSWGISPASFSGEGDGRFAALFAAGEIGLRQAASGVLSRIDESASAAPPITKGTVLVRIGEATHPEKLDGCSGITTFRTGFPARVCLLQTAARLYQLGIDLEWSGLFDPGRRMERLPLYPFQRSSYWIKAQESVDTGKLAPDGWFYETVWNNQPLSSSRSNTSDLMAQDGPATWLIFADKTGVADKLVHAISSRGKDFIRMVSVAASRPVGENTFPADGSDREQIDLLLTTDEVAEAQKLIVVHLQALDLYVEANMQAHDFQPAAHEMQDAEECLGSLVALCRGLARRKSQDAVKLWVVTRGAQAVIEAAIEAESRLQVAQAPIAGFSASAALEHPEFWGGTIDLPTGDGTEDGFADVILRECSADSRENRVAFRPGRRLVPRLRRKKALPQTELQMKPQATYLVTGAFGGIGLDLAEWLADRGARHVVLLGRFLKGNDHPDLKSTLQRLARLGVEVRLEACDVSDLDAMSKLFARLRDEGPPIRGILHAATEVIWKPVVELRAEDIKAAFRAKVQGSLVLHELTKRMNLDFLVFFSSAAVAIGARNAAAYAAANSFMDALAMERRSSGLPGLSVQWGLWMRRSPHPGVSEEQFTQSGLPAMSARKALNALGRLLQADVRGTGSPQCLIAALDLEQLKAGLALRGDFPFLCELKAALLTAEAGSPAISAIADLPREERVERLTALVLEQARRALDLGASHPLDITRGFFDMGFDSLKSIQFKNLIQIATGTVQSSTLVFVHPNVIAVARHLDASLFGTEMGDAIVEDPRQVSLIPDLRAGDLNEEETHQALLAELELFHGGPVG